MARTAQGRLLTDSHRRWQARLGATVTAGTLELAGLVDPADIVGTAERWLGQVLGLMAAAHLAGTDRAAAYVAAYRAVEAGAEGLPIVRSQFDPLASARAVEWAPRQALALARAGMKPGEASGGSRGRGVESDDWASAQLTTQEGVTGFDLGR